MKPSSLEETRYLLPARVPRWALGFLGFAICKTRAGQRQRQKPLENSTTKTGTLCWLIQAQVKSKSDFALITTSQTHLDILMRAELWPMSTHTEVPSCSLAWAQVITEQYWNSEELPWALMAAGRDRI